MVAVGASGRCIETREVSKPPVVQRTAQKLDPAQRRVKKGRGSGGTQTPERACLTLAHEASTHQHSREPES